MTWLPIENRLIKFYELSQQQSVNAELLATLEGIANANRLDREVFGTDAEFIDWAQSRARHAVCAAEKVGQL
jgi:hypothetical protein